MEHNQMLTHIESIPALIRDIFPALDKEAVRLATAVSDWPLTSVYLYGSGDSWAAAQGATSAFMELCGLPTFALPSMQASRYAPGYCMPPRHTVLAVGISSSGQVRRPLEATMALTAGGFDPILITSNPDSPGGTSAWEVYHTPVPPFDRSPGVRNYVAAQLALYLLAIRLAQATGRLKEAEAEGMVRDLARMGDTLAQALEEHRETLQRFAALCAKEQRVEFLASGPCRGAADFGVGKVLEATGYTALSPELEEFSHMNFFSLRPERIPTVLICPGSARCVRRALELERSTRHQGRPYLVLTDNAPFLASGEQLLRVSTPLEEKFAPLVFSFLTAALAAYMPLEKGDRYMHGHQGPFLEEGFPTIMDSEIIL